MTRGRDYQWVALRFDYARTGEITVRWRDERSRWSSPAPEMGPGTWLLPLPPGLDGLGVGLVVPAALHERVRSMPPYRTVAVFLDAPVHLRGVPLEALGEAALAGARDRGLVQFVRWARNRPADLRPFRLPLRVVAIGCEFEALRDRLRNAEWYASEPEVVDLGFQFELLDASSLARRLAPGEPPIDIVVLVESDLRRVLRAASAGAAPRLVACVGHTSSRPAWLSGLRVPSGASLAWFPRAATLTASEQAKQLTYEVIHDRPLHEAVNLAASAWSLGRPGFVHLVSDPVANQSMRLSDAAATLAGEVERLGYGVQSGDVEAFLARLGPTERERVGEPLLDAAGPGHTVRAATETASQTSVDYARESTGLNPLSHIRAAWKRALDAQPALLRRLRTISDDPAAVDIIRRHQARRVDVALQRLEPSPLMATDDATPWVPVESSVVLRGGAAYRVRVHVGNRAPGSLLTEPPPPLEPLLPDPPDARGHLLEFVVYGHDFDVISEGRRERHLPLLGGLDPVYFELRAPTAAPASGGDQRAQARIAVYFQGNLLQSFLLRALIAPEEEWRPERCLGVELEFSQSTRLANLDELGPRTVSIAANETADGRHRLMFKSADCQADVTLTAGQIDDRIQQFRDTLLDATFTDRRAQEQRFPLAGARNWDEFDHYVRRLARDGAELFQGLYVSSAGLRPALRAIGESSDQLVQVVLHNPRFGLPWAGVYDRDTPDDDAPVCLGGHSREQIGNGAPLEFRCGHAYDSEAFCVFGFWGVRQRLEYRLAGGGDPVSVIDPAPAQRRVCLALGDLDAFTQELADGLRRELGAASVSVLATDEDPLDVLWSGERPAEIVVLGHLETPAGQPNDPRIVLLGSAKPLRNVEVFRRVKRRPWDAPQSLVLLMACGSAVTDLRSLVTLLETFTAAPAGAVVGTETPVLTSLVSRFAADLTVAMWRRHDRLPLGAAMTEARRCLLQEANPLAFAFSAYGNADVEIAA